LLHIDAPPPGLSTDCSRRLGCTQMMTGSRMTHAGLRPERRQAGRGVERRKRPYAGQGGGAVTAGIDPSTSFRAAPRRRGSGRWHSSPVGGSAQLALARPNSTPSSNRASALMQAGMGVKPLRHTASHTPDTWMASIPERRWNHVTVRPTRPLSRLVCVLLAATSTGKGCHHNKEREQAFPRFFVFHLFDITLRHVLDTGRQPIVIQQVAEAVLASRGRS